MYLLPLYYSYFLLFSYERLFNISYNTGLVLINSFSFFFLSGKLFKYPLSLNYIALLGRVILLVGPCFSSL